jgi:hypothetical protein
VPLLGLSKDRTQRGKRSRPTRQQHVLQNAWHVSFLAILPDAKNGLRSCCDCGGGQHACQSTAAACAQHTIRQHSPQLHGQCLPAPAMNDWDFTWHTQDRAMDGHRVLPSHFRGHTLAVPTPRTSPICPGCPLRRSPVPLSVMAQSMRRVRRPARGARRTPVARCGRQRVALGDSKGPTPEAPEQKCF